jgi:hypothetical protein
MRFQCISQEFNDFHIRRREFMLIEVGRFHPLELLAFDGLWLSTYEGAFKDMERDYLFFVFMEDCFKESVHAYLDIQLFFYLPSQAFFKRFSWLLLAAGEFPKACKVIAWETLCYKDIAVVEDERSSDVDVGFDGFVHSICLKTHDPEID